MSSILNSGSDYDLLKEKIDTVILKAKIIEGDDRFTIAETGNSLFTIPNDHIVRITRDNEDVESGLAEIRIEQNAKILRKTLVSASQLPGIVSIGLGLPQGSGGGICEQCCNVCCEQCCNAVCEQCCQVAGRVDYQGIEAFNVSPISGSNFKRVITEFR